MTAPYLARRARIQEYFDRTAADAWARLTSEAPVSRIRATVRAGRDQMRRMLLAWLPEDCRGARILDAGCGTGQLARELAGRGARVVAVDLSPTLTALAAERSTQAAAGGSVEFRAGDMLDPGLGTFDYVVAMDSLIHYDATEMVAAVETLAARTRHTLLFTFAPRTALLLAMHTAGRCFPRADRSPAIAPIAERTLRRQLSGRPALRDWAIAWTGGVRTGFYRSQAVAYVRGHR